MSGDNATIENVQRDYYCHTRQVERTGRLIWKISNFATKCPSQNGEKLTSGKFRIPGRETDWHLNLFPNGYRGHEGFVSMHLFSNMDGKVFVNCEIALINASGVRLKEVKFSSKSDYSLGLGYMKVMPRKELLDGLNNDELTVSCFLTERVQVTGQCVIAPQESSMPDHRRNSILNRDLVKFYDVEKGSDVVLKVGTECLFAHKIVPMSRSPVFASMFEHDMLERDTNEVVIADVDIDVLRELVRFMYTDEIRDKGTEFTLRLLMAADKYDIPSLKARCAECLLPSVSAENVFQVLKVADACNERRLVGSCSVVIERETSSMTCLKGWVSKLNAHPEVLAVIEKYLFENEQ